MRCTLLFLMSLLFTATAWGDGGSGAALHSPDVLLHEAARDDGVMAASVVLDGETLFRVRGISAAPAAHRAANIREAIINLANDATLDAHAGEVVSGGDRIVIRIAGQRIATLYPADAALEQVTLDVLAEASMTRIAEAVDRYREERSHPRLLASTGLLLAITLAAGVLLYAVKALFGWFNRLIEKAVRKRIQEIERASHRIIDAAQLWSWLGGVVRGIRAVALVAIVLGWLNASLGLYPWTRPFASNLFHLILNPLQKMGTGLLQSLPDLIFLVLLAIVVRAVLRATKVFFERVDRGRIRLENFDRDWAMPTYRIMRILVIAFALVVAYPYIPGSESEAFKGVSIFLGVVFSIGSSSFIANMIAGYSLTYRGAFREGDRVRIGDHMGEVVNVRALSTQLRSPKNEDVNIPNSEVLGSTVVNYSSFSREKGVILHTDVGIGYDTPWRQVEALLLMAAGRTDGLEADPEPFVLQTQMGDFTVIYQLNAYCRDATRMLQTYSELHANIQDVFNEHEVQIMSPHYERDPEVPKVVAPEDWYPAPAKAPEQS
tara:strand:+ start:19376 stop:21019 length:1644 start_codon:yes stop_codon:yes gene_type:complete